MLLANTGDLANTALLGYFMAYLLDNSFLLALIPVLAALRGAVMTSMSSRVSTRLLLGVEEPSIPLIVRREIGGVLAQALFSAVYAGVLVSLLSGQPGGPTVSAAAVSSIIALLVLLPVSVSIIVAGYRRSLNPDNFMAPILTVIGDVSTVPSLMAAGLLVSSGGSLSELLAVASAYASVVLLAAGSYMWRHARRAVWEGVGALLLVGLVESGTGSVYSVLAPTLMTLGVVHMVPSLMEDIGASLAVFASRLSSMMHLYGAPEAVRRSSWVLAEIYLASVPSMLVLSVIGYTTAGLMGSSPALGYLVKTVVVLWTLLLLLLTPVVVLLSWASMRASLDPDNTVIPLITSIVDLSVPIALYLVARALA